MFISKHSLIKAWHLQFGKQKKNKKPIYHNRSLKYDLGWGYFKLSTKYASDVHQLIRRDRTRYPYKNDCILIRFDFKFLSFTKYEGGLF